jgi:hypothetical protein
MVQDQPGQIVLKTHLQSYQSKMGCGCGLSGRVCFASVKPRVQTPVPPKQKQKQKKPRQLLKREKPWKYSSGASQERQD